MFSHYIRQLYFQIVSPANLILFFLKSNVSVSNYSLKCTNLRCMIETDKLQKEFLIQLGQRLKKIRQEKGLSQSEVANLCGNERQSYERVENGRINPTIWYLKHIA